MPWLSFVIIAILALLGWNVNRMLASNRTELQRAVRVSARRKIARWKEGDGR